MSLTCPNCKAEGSYQASKEVGPRIQYEVYVCENPDCRLSQFAVVVSE